MERIENIGFGGLKLIQDPEAFCYGVDAVILADFAVRFCPDFSTAVDLGTGNGVIPFILGYKNNDASITGIDVQETAIDMARRSCSINGMEDRIDFIHGDVSRPWELPRDKEPLVDMVTCNPPYFIKNGAIPNSNDARFIARHETTASVEDFIKTAHSLLKRKGHFFMVHRPSRLVDIFCSCRKYKLEPKDIRYVTPRAGEIPNIVLIHCVAGGGKELKHWKELCIYDDDGSYTEEIERIYERQQPASV